MTEQQAVLLWNRADRARRRFSKHMEAATTIALNSQLEMIIGGIQHGVEQPENLANEYPIQQLFVLLYGTVGVEFARQTFLSVKSVPIELLTKGSKPQADELHGNWLRQMRKLALEKNGDKITGITHTTREFARKTLAKAKELGEDAVSYLRNKWNEIIKNRAKVIAKSEISAASSAGALLGAKSVNQLLQKSWLSQRDSKVRNSHHHADGQTVALDEPFIVNGYEMQQPCDPTFAPISETVNCRCFLTFS